VANTQDFALCTADGTTREAAPTLVDPFYALRTHFGMLLGVEDFELIRSYHLGKMRLHNAWLHGAGVVWGMNVHFQPDGELRVDEGLALDVAGHELNLDVPACLDVGAWYAKHLNDTAVKDAITDWNGRHPTVTTGVHFDGYVAVRFRSCLSREVPALLEPCAGATQDTAFSRVVETVELELFPGRPPARIAHWHKLRLVFGLDEAAVDGSDGDLVHELDTVRALPATERPAAFATLVREAAALDVAKLGPFETDDGTRTLFPGAENEWLVLAELTDLSLVQVDSIWQIDHPDDHQITITHRDTLLPTGLLQELIAASDAEEVAAASAGANGPRFSDFAFGTGSRGVINMLQPDTTLTNALLADGGGLLPTEAFSVTSMTTGPAWTVHVISQAKKVMSGTRPAIELTFAPDVPASSRVRVIARGTGPAPLLNAVGVPLAGRVGGPPGTAEDGHDAVFMKEGI
jgi:hypothetical protein